LTVPWIFRSDFNIFESAFVIKNIICKNKLWLQHIFGHQNINTDVNVSSRYISEPVCLLICQHHGIKGEEVGMFNLHVSI
jgi:hypothetical protein